MKLVNARGWKQKKSKCNSGYNKIAHRWADVLLAIDIFNSSLIATMEWWAFFVLFVGGFISSFIYNYNRLFWFCDQNVAIAVTGAFFFAFVVQTQKKVRVFYGRVYFNWF